MHALDNPTIRAFERALEFRVILVEPRDTLFGPVDLPINLLKSSELIWRARPCLQDLLFQCKAGQVMFVTGRK